MNWLKLGVPLLLAAAAGTINWVAMSQGDKSAELVCVKDDIKIGTLLSDGDFQKIELRGDPGTLKQTAIPYEQRLVLYNKPLMRDLKKGDLVLWRDVTPPALEVKLGDNELLYPVSLEGLAMPPQLIQVGDQVEFILVTAPGLDKADARTKDVFSFAGPFRVLSLGDIVTRKAPDDSSGDQEQKAGQQRSITIALTRKGQGLDDESDKLVRAKNDERSGLRRIVEMVLRPKKLAK